MVSGKTNLESPDGLEKSEIGIFHELTRFQSCCSLQVVGVVSKRSRSRTDCGHQLNLLAAAARNFSVISVTTMPSLDITGGGGSSKASKYGPGLGLLMPKSMSSEHLFHQRPSSERGVKPQVKSFYIPLDKVASAS